MFETDADRLAMIKSLGGLLLSVRGKSFWALSDNASADAFTMVESSDPFLTARTSDVMALEIVKDDVVEGLDTILRIKKHEPDGQGMSRLILKT